MTQKSTKVNSFIKKDEQKILGDINTFEEYIIRDYLYIYEKAIIISENVIGYFELLKNSIKVQTVVNTIVPPIVSQRDIYINDRKEVSELISRSKSYNRPPKSDLKAKK